MSLCLCIVATMMVGSIRRLLPHNVSDFRRFSAYIDILPIVKIP
jgi:hypothetical protein